MHRIAAETQYNSENNSYVYTVSIENVPEANRILNDVFEQVNISDTTMFYSKPLAIENVYKHIDFSAYAVQLGEIQSVIIVCRTTDLEKAIERYRAVIPGKDSTNTNPFVE
jgi:hypothetical protein